MVLLCGKTVPHCETDVNRECVTVEKQGFYKKIQFLDRSDDMSHPVRNIYKYTGNKLISG